MSLLQKLQKNSTIKAVTLNESTLFKDKDNTPTSVPMINVALSGNMDEGLTSGLTTIAGPSKHFKTAFGLLMLSSYLSKNKDAIVLFYDSEFGATPAYFESFGIDTSRVLHVPIKNVEELKFDIIKQLENIERKDNVLIFIDSIGNLASKKEVDDALEGSSKADMTRAKQFKSLFRMVTPYLTINDLPMIVINHTYKTQEMYSKDVVGGGTGVYYSSDTIWIVGRQQEKEGKEVIGYDFIVNVEKSRYVKEKSKIPVSVTFDNGISRWTGLLDVALELGVVTKPKIGWYSRVIPDENGEVKEDKLFRKKDTNNSDFWNPVFENTDFKELVRKKYTLSTDDIMKEE